MATTYKLLGAVSANGAIGTYTTLYSCPSATATVISALKAVNKDAAAQTIRIAVGATTTTPGATEWDVYGYTIQPNDTLTLVEGLCVDATNKYVMISASDADVNFKLYGAEIA